MGTLAVEKSTLQAMMLEILLRDKEFFKDILREIIKKDSTCLEEFTFLSGTTVVDDAVISSNGHQNSEDIGEAEARKIAQHQFEKYSTVFKALA